MRTQVLTYLQALTALFFHGEVQQRQQRVVVLALIVFLTGFAIWDTQPRVKPVRATDQPAFSLPDAQAQLTQLAREKHPIGSAANVRVREYLIDQIRALGYTPQIQSEFVNVGKEHLSAQVENILVRIAGSKPGNKALLLAAHYDSAPNSYGDRKSVV